MSFCSLNLLVHRENIRCFHQYTLSFFRSDLKSITDYNRLQRICDEYQKCRLLMFQPDFHFLDPSSEAEVLDAASFPFQADYARCLQLKVNGTLDRVVQLELLPRKSGGRSLSTKSKYGHKSLCKCTLMMEMDQRWSMMTQTRLIDPLCLSSHIALVATAGPHDTLSKASNNFVAGVYGDMLRSQNLQSSLARSLGTQVRQGLQEHVNT